MPARPRRAGRPAGRRPTPHRPRPTLRPPPRRAPWRGVRSEPCRAAAGAHREGGEQEQGHGESLGGRRREAGSPENRCVCRDGAGGRRRDAGGWPPPGVPLLRGAPRPACDEGRAAEPASSRPHRPHQQHCGGTGGPEGPATFGDGARQARPGSAEPCARSSPTRRRWPRQPTPGSACPPPCWSALRAGGVHGLAELRVDRPSCRAGQRVPHRGRVAQQVVAEVVPLATRRERFGEWHGGGAVAVRVDEQPVTQRRTVAPVRGEGGPGPLRRPRLPVPRPGR